jgi:hypothetical protein
MKVHLSSILSQVAPLGDLLAELAKARQIGRSLRRARPGSDLTAKVLALESALRVAQARAAVLEVQHFGMLERLHELSEERARQARDEKAITGAA